MIIVDVNLLLYAVFTSFPEHKKARRWWEATLNGSEQVGLTPPIIFGFLRIATNRRAFTSPLSVEAATGHVRDWLDQPNVRFLSGGDRHLEIAFRLLESVGTGGNLTTDVQIAALAIEHDAEVRSNDTDFGRFAAVRWANPLA